MVENSRFKNVIMQLVLNLAEEAEQNTMGSRSLVGVDYLTENVQYTTSVHIIHSLQNAGPSGHVFLGHVFKNAAQDILKPRFLKKGLKEKRASRVLYAGPQPSSSSAFFTHLSASFWGQTQAAFSTRNHRTLFFLGWSYCTAFVFVFPSHVLNLSLKSPTPSLFSLTLDLFDLLPSLSPSIADLTVADPSPI